MAEPKDPTDEYDSKHGAPKPFSPPPDEWGESLNPMQNPAVPAKKLRKVGE